MRHPFRLRSLMDILAERFGIVPESVDHAADLDDKTLGERLVKEQHITAEQHAQALAELFGLPYADLQDSVIAPELFERLPASQAYQLGVAPCRLTRIFHE